MWPQVAMAVISAMSSASKVDISQAQGTGSAFSGSAVFENDDVISMGKDRFIDFSDPKSVLIAGAVLVGVIYAFKKIKRF